MPPTNIPARFLMCPPDYFGVEYVINPWMEGKLGQTRLAAAHLQWEALHTGLTETLGATTILVPPRPGLPDIVFTANAAIVRSGIAVPSRFRFAERAGEEPYYRAALIEAGCALHDLPPGIAFEGAGDALFQEPEKHSDASPLLWAAHGFRTDIASHAFLAETFGVEVIALRLVDPRYYHLDTCFCPLPGGCLLWYPPAFDPQSQARITARLPEEKRHAVSAIDAANFACNAVAVGYHIVVNTVTVELRDTLAAWGFITHETPLTEFMKAGGSAKCLTLSLQIVCPA